MESAVELASVNPKSKKKPKLCYHLKIALDRVANRQLQQRVLDFARHHADAFRAPEDQALTASDITLVNEPAYGRRFDHAAWARLLRIVQQVTDAGDEDDRVLWPSWRAAHVTNEGVRREQVSTLVTAFCSTPPRLGSRPVTKADPSFPSLRYGIVKFLDSSANELRSILTPSPCS
ncbi:hypothetical protein CBS470a_011809 [Colletotrichum nupharicola]|nr:hypothetical protein CBS470a_011809 [Colletotrichum nupharicola]